MSDAIGVIDKLLEEHEIIYKEFTQLSTITGDVDAAAQLKSEQVKEYFVPRGLGGQEEGLKKWKAQLDEIEDTLHKHFTREEVSLTEALQDEDVKELLDALNELLAEHDDIKAHLERLHTGASDIMSGGLRVDVWQAEGWGMKHNIDSFREKLEAHAERERILFGELKTTLQAA